MNYLTKGCPVPRAQQPVHEYSSLKASVDFTWTQGKTVEFVKRVSSIFLTLCIIWSLLLFNIHAKETLSVKNFLLVLTLSAISITFMLGRYYASWYHVYSRLMQSTIAYEESGWYDGQIWVKPSEVLLQDRLIGTYELLPTLNRLRRFINWFILFSALGLFIFEFIIK